MKKSPFAFILGALLVLSACTATVDNADDDDMDMMDHSSSMMMDDDSMMDDDASSASATSSDDDVTDASSAPATDDTTADASAPRVIRIEVANWTFSPNVITAKKGEKVQLQLVGGNGIHSFAVADLGLNVRVEAGQTTVVDLPTDMAGTFEARCRIPCGTGHMDMKATVIIEE